MHQYVLFPNFRPHDVLMGIFILFFHKLCIHLHEQLLRQHLKEAMKWGSITFCEMGKQHVQAKKV